MSTDNVAIVENEWRAAQPDLLVRDEGGNRFRLTFDRRQVVPRSEHPRRRFGCIVPGGTRRPRATPPAAPWPRRHRHDRPVARTAQGQRATTISPAMAEELARPIPTSPPRAARPAWCPDPARPDDVRDSTKVWRAGLRRLHSTAGRWPNGAGGFVRIPPAASLGTSSTASAFSRPLSRHGAAGDLPNRLRFLEHAETQHPVRRRGAPAPSSDLMK